MLLPHLVLLPGLLCDDEVWREQSSVFRRLTTVSVPDYELDSSLETMAARVLRTSPGRFALAGHSMGGRVALEIVRREPDRVVRLALLDTAYRGRAEGEADERERGERFALLEIAKTRGMRQMGIQWAQKMVHPDRLPDQTLMEAIFQMIERKTADIFSAQINALLTRPDATDVLQKVSCPTMVLCGRQDFWSPLAIHEEMARRIPQCTLAVIEHSGHMSTMERPDAVTSAMREWLSGPTAPETNLQ